MNARSFRGASRFVAAALLAAGLVAARSRAPAADNALSEQEEAEGWILLFDGQTTEGWMTNTGKAVASPIQHGSLNPHRSGGYLIVHQRQFGDFIFACDFKISPGCNSGIFFRVGDLDNVVQTGIEMQILDSRGHGMHDTGAIYDMVPPSENAMKPAGQWNHVRITCDDNQIAIALNGREVTTMDLDRWTEPGRRLDGSRNKFRAAFKDMPRRGYLGFQDHGKPCWFKNIKIKPLD